MQSRRSAILVIAFVVAAYAVYSGRQQTGINMPAPVKTDTGRPQGAESQLERPDEGLLSQREPGASRESDSTAPELLVIGGAPRVNFTIQDAQAHNRSILVPLRETYRPDFRRFALKWSKWDISADGDGFPSSATRTLNPEEHELDAAQEAQFHALIARYNDDLEALAVVAYEHACDGVAQYYDTLQGGGWFRQGTEPPPHIPPANPGRWNLSLTVGYAGHQRKIRFDSSYHGPLEQCLEAIQSLQAERFEAARGFFAALGPNPAPAAEDAGKR